MYSDQDLDSAVAEGIFSQEAIAQFRSHIHDPAATPPADEENFRLINSFNDIFVVTAALLLIFSLASLAALTIHIGLGAITAAATAWGLAEFFVLKRRMALPAILLLFVFIVAVFATPFMFSATKPDGTVFAIAAVLTSIAAWLHWRRFHVPITIAAASLLIISSTIFFLVSFLPNAWLLPLLFSCGLLTFGVAMAWDIADTRRQSKHSDVAFWLHLTAAPMMVHPIFVSLGMLEGSQSLFHVGIIGLLYLVFTFISLAIDRRAIMVSSLAYVLYSFTTLLEAFGVVSLGFALIGIVFGASLLLLSAFWQRSRAKVMTYLPQRLTAHLPPIQP